MAQAKPDVSRIPSGVTRTSHVINAAEIAAKNNRARLSIGREVEELLRIRREADEAAFRLIALLDLDEPDPDLEPSFGGDGHGDDGMEREADTADDEPSLGWTIAMRQEDRKWQGIPPLTGRFAWGVVVDGEAEPDEPNLGAPETVPGPQNPVYWASGIDRRYSQEDWGAGNRSDMEDQCEGEGEACEDEGAGKAVVR